MPIPKLAASGACQRLRHLRGSRCTLAGQGVNLVSWGMREWSRKQQKCTKTWEKPVICKEYPWSFKMFKGMVFWGSKFFLLLLSQGIPLIWKAGESSWSFPSSFKITPKSWVTKKKTGPLLNPWNPVCSNPGSWFHALWNNIYLTG